MSSNFKAAAPHVETIRAINSYRVAIVGAASLKGKELAEVLNDRNFPSLDVKLLDDDESLGKLETMKDEVTFIQSVRPEQFDNVDFTFFACDPESTRANWKSARKAGSDIVDLSYALEDEPGATVRSPWIERQIGRPLGEPLQRLGPALADPHLGQRQPELLCERAFHMLVHLGERGIEPHAGLHADGEEVEGIGVEARGHVLE